MIFILFFFSRSLFLDLSCPEDYWDQFYYWMSVIHEMEINNMKTSQFFNLTCLNTINYSFYKEFTSIRPFFELINPDKEIVKYINENNITNLPNEISKNISKIFSNEFSLNDLSYILNQSFINISIFIQEFVQKNFEAISLIGKGIGFNVIKLEEVLNKIIQDPYNIKFYEIYQSLSLDLNILFEKLFVIKDVLKGGQSTFLDFFELIPLDPINNFYTVLDYRDKIFLKDEFSLDNVGMFYYHIYDLMDDTLESSKNSAYLILQKLAKSIYLILKSSENGILKERIKFSISGIEKIIPENNRSILIQFLIDLNNNKMKSKDFLIEILGEELTNKILNGIKILEKGTLYEIFNEFSNIDYYLSNFVKETNKFSNESTIVNEVLNNICSLFSIPEIPIFDFLYNISDQFMDPELNLSDIIIFQEDFLNLTRQISTFIEIFSNISKSFENMNNESCIMNDFQNFYDAFHLSINIREFLSFLTGKNFTLIMSGIQPLFERYIVLSNLVISKKVHILRPLYEYFLNMLGEINSVLKNKDSTMIDLLSLFYGKDISEFIWKLSKEFINYYYHLGCNFDDLKIAFPLHLINPGFLDVNATALKFSKINIYSWINIINCITINQTYLSKYSIFDIFPILQLNNTFSQINSDYLTYDGILTKTFNDNFFSLTNLSIIIQDYYNLISKNQDNIKKLIEPLFNKDPSLLLSSISTLAVSIDNNELSLDNITTLVENFINFAQVSPIQSPTFSAESTKRKTSIVVFGSLGIVILCLIIVFVVKRKKTDDISDFKEFTKL